MKRLLLVLMLLTVCVWADDNSWFKDAKSFEVYIGNAYDGEIRDQIAFLGVETVADTLYYDFIIDYDKTYQTADENGDSFFVYGEQIPITNERHYLNLRINGTKYRIVLEEVVE